MRPSGAGAPYPPRKARNSETNETGLHATPIFMGGSGLPTLGVQTKPTRNQSTEARNFGGGAGRSQGEGAARRSSVSIGVSDLVGAVWDRITGSEEPRDCRKPITCRPFWAHGFAGFGVSDFLGRGLGSADLQSPLAPWRLS